VSAASVKFIYKKFLTKIGRIFVKKKFGRIFVSFLGEFWHKFCKNKGKVQLNLLVSRFGENKSQLGDPVGQPAEDVHGNDRQDQSGHLPRKRKIRLID